MCLARCRPRAVRCERWLLPATNMSSTVLNKDASPMMWEGNKRGRCFAKEGSMEDVAPELGLGK